MSAIDLFALWCLSAPIMGFIGGCTGYILARVRNLDINDESFVQHILKAAIIFAFWPFTSVFLIFVIFVYFVVRPILNLIADTIKFYLSKKG